VASQYERLRIARDLAAYRAVGHIDAAICYCRQGDAKMALSILLNARATYNAAANALDNHTTSKKQSSAEGDQSAAA
jgi:hypothetical protein